MRRGRVLDYGQDIGLGAAGQVDREEVAGQDRLGLGAQELWPGRPGLPRPGSMPLALRISQTVDAATLTPSPASSPWILRYPVGAENSAVGAAWGLPLAGRA
jgi:hypothetical protein